MRFNNLIIFKNELSACYEKNVRTSRLIISFKFIYLLIYFLIIENHVRFFLYAIIKLV